MMIKVKSVECNDIDLLVIDERKRKYMLSSPVTMKVHTDEGVIEIRAKSGVFTDGRSGGRLVDWLIPNIGDKYFRRAWFSHDCLYSFGGNCLRDGAIPPISFELANELFEQIGRLPKRLGGGGVSSWRMSLAYKGVENFGRRAYDKLDKTDRANDGKISIVWKDR